MFSVATIFLVAFALNLQGAVYGSSSVTPSLSSTYSSISSSPTSSTSVSGQITSSPTQPPSTTALSQNATSPTSATTSETPSTSGTASPPDETTSQPTGTQPLDIKKICASVTVTLKETLPEKNVTQILSQFLVSESNKYSDLNITNLNVNGNKVNFAFCVKSNSDGNIESDTKRHLMNLLNATVVKLNIQGAEITDWKVVDGECEKCSGGGGGPIKIRGTCKPKTDKYSCGGVDKVVMETTDCSKYCSGVVSFTVSYLLVSVGIALSLSFYL